MLDNFIALVKKQVEYLDYKISKKVDKKLAEKSLLPAKKQFESLLDYLFKLKIKKSFKPTNKSKKPDQTSVKKYTTSSNEKPLIIVKKKRKLIK